MRYTWGQGSDLRWAHLEITFEKQASFAFRLIHIPGKTYLWVYALIDVI